MQALVVMIYTLFASWKCDYSNIIILESTLLGVLLLQQLERSLTNFGLLCVPPYNVSLFQCRYLGSTCVN